MQIEQLLDDPELEDKDIAAVVGCSIYAVSKIRWNLCEHGTTKAPSRRTGRRPDITPTMKGALFDHLVEKPELYQDEMVVFLWDEFRVMISRFSIGRLLKTANWTKKVLRRIARERSAEVRADYLERISTLDHRRFIFVDESGCDKRIGFRR